MPQFAHQVYVFHPAKTFFDLLTLPDTYRIPFVAGGTTIDRGMFLLRDMRGDLALAAIGYKGFGVVVLVRSQRPSVCPRLGIQQCQSLFALSSSSCQTDAGLNDQAVAVLGQQVSHEVQTSAPHPNHSPPCPCA